VAVLPSRAEAMPMFLLEAQAARRPVVATPVGGVPSVVERGGGELVGVEDIPALSRALQRILIDGAYADRLGAAGAGACAASYGAEVIDRTYRSLYARLLPA
jgi:glycosyltransferase involved in cell wall biosynthesis